MALDGPWEVEVVATLEDDWGDLAAPAADVETWELDSDAGPVHATFGPRAGRSRRVAAQWSLSRGILKDPVHVDYLGGSGRVPEEFLHFDAASARLRAVIHAPHALTTNLAVGANAAKRAWLDGDEVALTGRGYLASGPVSLAAGETLLELDFTATEAPVRGHFAFVADLDGYARPEFLRAAGAGRRARWSRSRRASRCRRRHLGARPGGRQRPRSGARRRGRGRPPRRLRSLRGDRQGPPAALRPHEHLNAGEHELRLELLTSAVRRRRRCWTG